MWRSVQVIVFSSLIATPVFAQTAIPDLRGTWVGQSESIILGGGNDHHPATQPPTIEPRLHSPDFTMNIDKQDGRRFSGTFSSTRHSETIIGYASRAGTIFVIDDDGYSSATLLAPDRMELCYLHQSPDSHIVSCTEMKKQP